VCNGGHGCPSYYFPSFDKSCAADTECDVFNHFESCCMSRMIGVSTRDKSRAEAIETQCTSLLDQAFLFCGCPPMQTAEDGTSTALSGQTIVGACVSGTCMAVVRGRITCGTTSCAEGESCCQVPDSNGYCTTICAATCPAVSGCTIPQ
jgi:hypothetical protein